MRVGPRAEGTDNQPSDAFPSLVGCLEKPTEPLEEGADGQPSPLVWGQGQQNRVTIPVALELPKIKAGQKCSFKLQLDDVDKDACGEAADNRSTGEFTLSERGAQAYKPEDHWGYTIRWHLN